MNKDGLPFCFPEFIFLLLKQIFILLLMPANRNALIRYKTIDNCLRNPYRRWTLEDLVDACSDALYEYEGIDKGISKRTAQMDIQMMRSEKLGYNAPIVVYENKYYKYEDPEYSITQTPLNEQDLKMMSEAVEVLRQFKGFSYFTEMSEIINRLEDHVASARMKTTPVIDFEKNESLKGLDYLDTIYHAIVNEHPIQLKYRSFKARSANSFIFYPYLLKEYRNRWFVYGVRGNGRILQNLALDRIQSLEVLPQEHYIKNTFFDPNTFFDDLVGVTKNSGSVAEKVGFKVAAAEAPYIITKPIHRSQQLVERLPDGSVILEIGNLRTFGFQLLRSIESDICLAGIQQHLYILLVYVAAFGLTVRTMFSTKADTLVKRNAQPLERLQYIFFRSRHKPVGIGILNAENQISSMLTGKEIIIQRSAHTTDVQRPRRTRGKTDSDFSFCHNLSYL